MYSERAIQTVMRYYDIDRETALKYYEDEIQSAERLIAKFDEEGG